MDKTVILSDNKPCRVRVLNLFELDGVGRSLLGPYTYSILTPTGQIIEDEYNLHAFDEPPPAPDIPPDEVVEGSTEWYQLREHETYQAALAHEKKRLEAYEGYLGDITRYILDNCLEGSDRNRIVEPEDWLKIQAAAIVPQLTEEVIADTLRNTFQGVIR